VRVDSQFHPISKTCTLPLSTVAAMNVNSLKLSTNFNDDTHTRHFDLKKNKTVVDGQDITFFREYAPVLQGYLDADSEITLKHYGVEVPTGSNSSHGHPFMRFTVTHLQAQQFGRMVSAYLSFRDTSDEVFEIHDIGSKYLAVTKLWGDAIAASDLSVDHETLLIKAGKLRELRAALTLTGCTKQSISTKILRGWYSAPTKPVVEPPVKVNVVKIDPEIEALQKGINELQA